MGAEGADGTPRTGLAPAFWSARRGALRALLGRVVESDGAWTHPDWTLTDPGPLEDVLDRGAAIAYAPWRWTTGGVEEGNPATLEAFVARPWPAGVIAWRANRLAGIRWPDDERPDLVLDASADWCLLVMALAGGAEVGRASEACSVREAINPEHPDRLRDDGKRWLAGMARRWERAIGGAAAGGPDRGPGARA